MMTQAIELLNTVFMEKIPPPIIEILCIRVIDIYGKFEYMGGFEYIIDKHTQKVPNLMLPLEAGKTSFRLPSSAAILLNENEG
ncbi:MAG: hypothetical protein QW675_08265 [Nitrososphaerota archaeon]